MTYGYTVSIGKPFMASILTGISLYMENITMLELSSAWLPIYLGYYPNNTWAVEVRDPEGYFRNTLGVLAGVYKFELNYTKPVEVLIVENRTIEYSENKTIEYVYIQNETIRYVDRQADGQNTSEINASSVVIIVLLVVILISVVFGIVYMLFRNNEEEYSSARNI